MESKSLQKTVWKFVGNPGVILKGGRVIGIWKAKTLKDKLDLSIKVWENLEPVKQRELKNLAEEYAAFRLLRIRNYIIENG